MIKKEKSVAKLKKEAWKVFSQYIRLRDCRKTTGTLSHGLCYTCGRDYPYTRLQAGHFLAGRGGAVLFKEDQVHAQCMPCNVWNHGDFPTYQEKMRAEFGIEKVEEMIKLRHGTHQWKKAELIEIKEKYKKKVLEFI